MTLALGEVVKSRPFQLRVFGLLMMILITMMVMMVRGAKLMPLAHNAIAMPHKMNAGMPFLTWEQTTATWGIWSTGQGKLMNYQTYSLHTLLFNTCTIVIEFIVYNIENNSNSNSSIFAFKQQNCFIFRLSNNAGFSEVASNKKCTQYDSRDCARF